MKKCKKIDYIICVCVCLEIKYTMYILYIIHIILIILRLHSKK